MELIILLTVIMYLLVVLVEYVAPAHKERDIEADFKHLFKKQGRRMKQEGV